MTQPPLPFLDFLSGAVALDNVPALFDDQSDRWFRYGDLREKIKTLKPFLQAPTQPPARGLVLALLPRTIEGVCAYLSAAVAGHAILLIDPGAARPDLFIDSYEPDWVIVPGSMKPGSAYIPVDAPLTNLSLWRRTLPPRHDLHPDLFLLLRPPGPTDSVKTVRLTYANLRHNTLATLDALGLAPETRALLVMPLSYSFGLSILHLMLSIGGGIVLSEIDMKNPALWMNVQKREATLFAGVPFHYEYLARAKIENLHVPRLKTFLQAGGKMPTERTQEILRQVMQRNGQFFVLYGVTEASPRIACLPLHEVPDKIGSAGRLLKEGKIIAGPRRMTYQGPNVMMGYATSRADLALGDLQQGSFELAEQGHVDADGYLYLETT
ncbi:MAG: AMP-binding protein [Bdellovibrionales bacterium]